jgi:fimbrial isopeptide formation D2 family protein/uncharacterized repeat protein (TIGR01451 family)
MSFDTLRNTFPSARRLAFAATAALASAGLVATTVGCEDDEVELDTQSARFMPVLQQNVAEIEGDIAIEKSMPSEIRLGETTSYTIRYANSSGGDLTRLVITEELPEGFQFESANPEPSSVDGNKLMFNVSQLGDGANGEITINGTAQKLGDLKACTTYEFDQGVCTMLTVVNPELRLTKQLEGEGPFSVCTPVELVYMVKNEGDSAAEDVLLYDMLPDGMMFADSGERELEMELGNIEPGQSIEKSIMVKASQADTFGSYAVAKSELVEVKSQNVDIEFAEPKLQLQATAVNPFTYVGEDGRFNLQIRNDSDVVANRVVVGLAAGQGAEIEGVYGTEQDDQGQIQIDDEDRIFVGTLNPGQSRTVTVDVDLPDEEATVKFGAVAQAVCAGSGMELAKAEAVAQMEIRTISALQLEVVDKNDPVQVGTQTVYEITVINEGSGDDRNVSVKAELPQGLKYVSSQGDTETTEEGNSIAFAPVDVLASGESVTWWVTVEATEAAGGQKFKVMLDSENSDGETIEEEPTRLF